MNSKVKNGGPAFARYSFDNGSSKWNEAQDGMSLRDYFAAHAPPLPKDTLDSMLSIEKGKNPYNEPHKPRLRSRLEFETEHAFKWADAMLRAREVQS